MEHAIIDYLKVTRLSYNSAEKIHVKSKQNQLSKLEALMKRKQKQTEAAQVPPRRLGNQPDREKSHTQPARGCENGS